MSDDIGFWKSLAIAFTLHPFYWDFNLYHEPEEGVSEITIGPVSFRFYYEEIAQ